MKLDSFFFELLLISLEQHLISDIKFGSGSKELLEILSMTLYGKQQMQACLLFCNLFD